MKNSLADSFAEFLIKAKINTYAGDGKKSGPSRPESKDLHFSEGDCLYIDTYLGSNNFIGEEAVWEKGVPVWGMNYYGYMLCEDIPEGFTDCLKEALKKVPCEAPFRGPEYFKFKEYEYRCIWKGSLDCFSGTEEILLKGQKIYELSFHGGLIK